MPALETSDRLQDAVLFPFSGYDRFGQPTVSYAPVPLKVRWVEKQTEAMDKQGNTIALDATVVVDRRIHIGGLMWKGCIDDLDLENNQEGQPLQDGAEPYRFEHPPEDRLNDGPVARNLGGSLMEVKLYNETPDIRGRAARRTVGLMRFRDHLPVNKLIGTTVLLTSSAAPSPFGDPLTLTASVSGSLSSSGFLPKGKMYFYDGSTVIGVAPVQSGTATLTVSTLAVGGHTLSATYEGDRFYAGSESQSLQQVISY